MKRLGFILVVSVFSSAVFAGDIVGAWKPITGNQYRDQAIEEYKLRECSSKLRWFFKSDGVHTIHVSKDTCEITDNRERQEEYQQHYRYKLVDESTHYILKRAILAANTSSNELAYVYFVADDVFYTYDYFPWMENKKQLEQKKYYFQRIKQE